MTTHERTWCDLATLLTLQELVAAGDFLIRRREGPSTLAGLTEAVIARPGRRGRANLLAALGLLSDRAESPAESILRVEFIEAGLPELLVNVDIRDRSGRFVARPDLRFADYPIIIEYEGDYHRVDRNQWMKDITRSANLEALGFTVVRCTSTDLWNPAPVLARVRAQLVRCGWRP